VGGKVKCNVAQSSFLREIFRSQVRSFNLLLREVRVRQDDGVEPAYSYLRVKGHGELLLGPRPDSSLLRLYGEAGVLALLRLNSFEIKFKWIFTLVKASILSNSYVEGILACLSEVLLVE